jgi:LPS-assembly lipoprotein
MSSPEQRKRIGPTRPFLVVFALTIAGLASASGCTVRPLYSDAGYSAGAPSAATGSIGSALSTIAIKPAFNRVGQEVRNNLIFLFGGGKGEPVNPRYSLDLAVTSISEATTNIQINEQNEPTSAILTARATYRLTDSSGKVVSTGDRQLMASYDVPRQEFAAYRAQINAEDRAARELAELIRMAVAQDLAKRPASSSSSEMNSSGVIHPAPALCFCNMILSETATFRDHALVIDSPGVPRREAKGERWKSEAANSSGRSSRSVCRLKAVGVSISRSSGRSWPNQLGTPPGPCR